VVGDLEAARRRARAEDARRLKQLRRDARRATPAERDACEDCDGRGSIFVRGNPQTCHGCCGARVSRRPE